MFINGRIGMYCCQGLSWEQARHNVDGNIIYDEYGEPECEAAVVITGRKIGKYTKKVNPKGSEVVCDTYILTTADVAAEDKIDGRVVVSVKDIVDRDGTKVGVECYL